VMDYRLMSRPVPASWAGFETDTYKLQSFGWDISAEQEPMYHTMRIAIRHDKIGMSGVSERIPWTYFQDPYHSPERLPVVPLRCVSHKVMYEIYGSPAFNFEPVDAQPQMMAVKRGSLEEFIHFAPARAKGILLPEASVPDLMEQILKLQQPMREAEIKRSLLERPHKVHAQIISLAA
jgi:hypothetical protein